MSSSQTKRAWFGILAALLATCTVCAAQTIDAAMQAQLTQVEERFKIADKDSNGQLTLEEAKAGMPRVADAFGHIDVEKKGYITLEQIKAVMIKNGG